MTRSTDSTTPKAGRWDRSYDPDARPLGCNGKYGDSGLQAHRRAKTAACDACTASGKHYRQGLRRGKSNPRQLKPCGTWAAASRHRKRGEDLDFACRLAESDRNAARAKVIGRKR